MQPLTSTFTPEQFEKLKDNVSAFEALAERYRNEPALRSRIDGGDVADFLPDLGIEVPPGVDARIVANTTDTFHVVMPPDPNVEVSDEALTAVAGGSTRGTASTIGTAGCSTVASTVSSAGSAGSAGPPENVP